MDLFQFGEFTSHSGLVLPWKFDADALSDGSIEALAQLIASKLTFGEVYGIPRGGLRLAEALRPYVVQRGPWLIVDDVLTTGQSMRDARDFLPMPSIGVVILARGVCPYWVQAIMYVGEWAR